MTRYSLACFALLLTACGDDAPEAAEASASIEVATYTWSAGVPAEVPVEFGESWQVLACADGLCVDISERVVSDGGWLVGPVENDPLRYIESPDLTIPSTLEVPGAALTVTVTRPR